MMDVEALFNDLESNNPQTNEETKKKLAEIVNLTKDPGLVKDMMEYYLRTNSVRIIDVLIKVQNPHDNFVFDRLAEWLKTQQYRTASLSLFGYIVRKHPTWLHKVAKHKLIRDIFKLLQNEKEIVPLMSALLCVITLLPIIHSSTQQFLPELFEVFGHLASWNCQNPNRLCEYQLIHLQIGLHMLFYRLYGMYPWHFTIYLKEFINKEKGAIFHHTIKPLLETVRIHPLLITGTKESEAHISRWKDMEPHDVVIECAKLSLAVYNQDNNPDWFAIRCQETPYSNQHYHHNSSLRDTPFKPITGFSSPFHSLIQREKLMDYQKFDQIWSPHIEILATPPPPLPHTPTPNYGVPTNSTLVNSTNILGGTGSSPPEAAVEATPETTPMKDLNLKRGLMSNKPHAVRSILGSSQPSSPMRKEQSPFNFSENIQDNLPISLSHSQTYSQNMLEQSTTTTATTTIISNSSTISSQRFMQMVSDRNQAQSVPTNSLEVNTAISKLQPLTIRDISLCGLRNAGQMSLDSPTCQSENTREDQEVTELTSQQLGIAGSSVGGPHHSDTLQDISNECDDDCEEAERSPCSIGGLHVPTNRTMQLYVNRIKRNRLATYCQNDTSSYLSYGTSPADAATNELFHVSYTVNAKVRRTNSWPVIDRKYFINEQTIDFGATTTGPQHDNINSTSIATQQNGDSSSPSGDDVMSAATHFKKIQQKKDRKYGNISGATGVGECRILTKNDMINFTTQHILGNGDTIIRNSSSNLLGITGSGYNCIRNNVITKTSATQTVQQWPHIYEYNLLELFVEDNKVRNAAAEKPTLEPHEILNQYIDLTIKAKYSTDMKNREEEFKEQIQLLYLQLQYERHRREIHAERNRRLMGRSRDKRTLELENERLRDQLRNIDDQNKSLINELKTTRQSFKDKETKLNKELNIWKCKYQSELDDNKQLKFSSESIQRQLNDEIKNRQQANFELDVLHGEIFDLRNELQHTQYQAELGQQYKQDLIKLETEFMVMGEVQIKCRDRLNEIENLRARDEELKILQATFKNEIIELRSSLEDKTAQFDRAKYRLNELQSQLVNKEILFTDQKRLLKSVKDEYEEKFKALNKKYEAQKAIISQMEQKILELYKNRTAVVNLALSPESERTDIASSADRTSPLSTSLASSGDGLSASLRSVTELCNLQAIVNPASYKSSTIDYQSSKYTLVASSSAAAVITVANSSTTTTLHNTNLNPTYSVASSAITATISSDSGTIIGGSGVGGGNRQTAGSLDIPLPGPSQQNHYSAHHR